MTTRPSGEHSWLSMQIRYYYKWYKPSFRRFFCNGFFRSNNKCPFWKTWSLDLTFWIYSLLSIEWTWASVRSFEFHRWWFNIDSSHQALNRTKCELGLQRYISLLIKQKCCVKRILTGSRKTSFVSVGVSKWKPSLLNTYRFVEDGPRKTIR